MGDRDRLDRATMTSLYCYLMSLFKSLTILMSIALWYEHGMSIAHAFSYTTLLHFYIIRGSSFLLLGRWVEENVWWGMRPFSQIIGCCENLFSKYSPTMVDN